MWKITWYDVTSYPIKEETYDNFKDAKANFRLAITKKLGNKLTKINEYIDKFCQKNYKDNTSITFEQLKDILEKFITDPNYPSTNEEIEDFKSFYSNFEDYGDEKVDIFLNDICGLEMALYDINAKFFSGYIDLLISGQEPSYAFILEDNRQQFANNRIFAKIYLEDEERRDEINQKAQEETDLLIEAIKKAMETKD